MITLTLLHPLQSIPVQSWTFEHEPVIRIGRATDNHVILYSAVVSRHHVELRRVDAQWEIISLGANGTYLDGKRITQVPVVDGVIIRLARSGPNIQIHLVVPAALEKELEGEQTISQRGKPKPTDTAIASTDEASTQSSATASPAANPEAEVVPVDPPAQGDLAQRITSMDAEDDAPERSGDASPTVEPLDCAHPRAAANSVFCPDCGQPLRVDQVIGDYQVVKTLHQDAVTTTQLVWRNGQTLVLRTLNADFLAQPDVVTLFEQQARQVLQLIHPGLPRFTDFFVLDGKPYLVREQVYGQSLSQRVATQGPLAVPDAIAVVLQVCAVLDYLHSQSPPFLHLDLKPENLTQQTLMPATGQVAILGLVSLSALGLAQAGATAYIAPEQQQGVPTPASDLFALGPTLVYLLTGSDPAAFYAQREQGFRFYPEYVPGLEPPLSAIVRRLTNPQPEERYGSAWEVAAALSELR